jgi:NAD(P)-dependent dehydrogenase (short-subunit alcohol dehydrogenase family)
MTDRSKEMPDATQPFAISTERVRGLFDLSGKVALVTGAGQGIGRALAAAAAGAGAAVVCGDVNPETARATAAWLSASGLQAVAAAGDVSDDAQMADLVAAAEQHFGGLDILFNNAGISHRQARVHELLPEEWQRVLDVDLTSIYLAVRHAAPRLIARGGGKIINTASMWGFFASREYPLAAYTAAKGGVVSLTRQLALDYAADHINVNAIAPGFIRTGFTREELVPGRIALTPLGRYGEPTDLMGLAVFLAAPASDFITGQTIIADGGYTLY